MRLSGNEERPVVRLASRGRGDLQVFLNSLTDDVPWKMWVESFVDDLLHKHVAFSVPPARLAASIHRHLETIRLAVRAGRPAS